MNNTTLPRPTRVAVIGAGFVGSTFAYTLLLSGLASEIVLIDANRARAEGEAMDIAHATPLAPFARVWAGDYAACADADMIVNCAGANQKPGESRLDLLKRNAAILGQVLPQITESGFNGVLLMAANPVDVLTYLAVKTSGLPTNRVFGSGTVLDSARFRFEIAQHCNVAPQSVNGAILGEHGDSSQAAWSSVTVGGLPLGEFCDSQNIDFEKAERDVIARRVRDAAREIIQRKGATYYAIGAALTQIVGAVLRDENAVLPVSSLIENLHGISDVCLSLPTIVNKNGIARVLPLSLDEEELSGLQHSAQVLKNSIASLNE